MKFRRLLVRPAGQSFAPLEMHENLRHQRRILDTGDHPQCAPAIGAGLNVAKVN
jgi:hypothetical protein